MPLWQDPVDKVLCILRVDGVATTCAWFTGSPKHNEKNDGATAVRWVWTCPEMLDSWSSILLRFW